MDYCLMQTLVKIFVPPPPNKSVAYSTAELEYINVQENNLCINEKKATPCFSNRITLNNKNAIILIPSSFKSSATMLMSLLVQLFS